MSRAALLDVAIALLEQGFHIFPLGGHGESAPEYMVRDRFDGDQKAADDAWPKQPRVSWKVYQTVAPSEQTVRDWWGQWPNANIGIACGDLIAVDADSAESVNWCKANLPHTPWRVTTGKGVHFYYRKNPLIEVRNSVGERTKLDTRGFGGYVVAAGSRHASGNYYADDIDAGIADPMVSDLPLLDQSAVDAITAYRNGKLVAPMNAASPGGGNLAGFDASTVHYPADGSPVKEGGRNNAAASLAGTCFAKGLSLLETTQKLKTWNASNTPPLSDAELDTTIASVKKTHEANHPGETIPLVAPGPRTDITVVGALEGMKPTAVDRIPGVLGQVEDYYAATSIVRQPAFGSVASIVLGSVALARLFVARLAMDSYSGLYVCEVVGTGGGKEHARTIIEQFLNAADLGALIGPTGYTSAAGVFSALVEQPCHYTFMDELGRHLAASKQSGDSHQQQMMSELLKRKRLANPH